MISSPESIRDSTKHCECHQQYTNISRKKVPSFKKVHIEEKRQGN